ncbi:MAG: hypothetical protein OER90_12205, partial [Gemmatimonadota bacterium]|nr:hypothetical protein [Gemmatimonadota bacterium]
MLSAVAVSTCQLDELIGPPESSTPSFSPTALRDSAAVGSTALRSLTVSVSTNGAGTLSWTATTALKSAWLTLSALSGTAPSSVTITLNPAGLAEGVHRDTILVSATGSAEGPARIPVEFTVYPCRAQSVAVGAVVTDSLTASDCTGPNRSDHFAKLYQFTAAAGDSVTVVLRSTAFDAFLVLDSSASGVGPILGQGDTCEGVGPDVCLLYVLLPKAGTYWIQATSSAARQTGAFTLDVTAPRAPNAPTQLAQLLADSTTPVVVGGVVSGTSLVLAGTVSDIDTTDLLRLEVEVRPVGTPFANTATSSSLPIGSGERSFIVLPPLSDDVDYHWQARTRDETGRTSAWVPFGTNAEAETDFRIAEPESPNEPTSLSQFKTDGTTGIALGDTTDERTVVLRGTVTDIDAGDSVRLEVEVQPVGTPFAGTATGSSVFLPSGSSAIATLAGLDDDVDYHWQARTADKFGLASAWINFGGNPETDTDF